MGGDNEQAVITKAFSTLQFRSSLKDIKKQTKKGKSLCGKDVCDLFNHKSIDDIEKMGPRLKGAGDYSFYKIRIGDSTANIGKRGSYRAIVGIKKTPPEITLTYIYIKRGSQGVDDIGNEFLKSLIVDFIQERNAGGLEEHQLADNLDEI